MKDKLREQKGFAVSDSLIAILIIILFSALIGTISYNIYLSNSSLKRMSKATGYIVDVFEYIEESNYENVTKENLISYFNKKYYYEADEVTPKADAEVKIQEDGENIDTLFKAEITVVKYNETEGNTEKLDLVQEITMTVKYRLGNKNQEITMTRNKTKE